jgi:nucleotide-binding universal stress UspA family protein
MFERILIPLDGSRRAELILGQVARILRRKDSEVLLLRVVEVPSDVRLGHSPRAMCRACELERAEARQYIRDLVRKLEGRGVNVRGSVAEGPAAATILEQAKLERATLIAMTTHGRGGVSRWLVGSVAEKVARASTVPLLLIRSFRPTPLGDLQSAPPEELPFRMILVPTDGSPAASRAIGPAAELAELFDAGVTVLHVEVPLPVLGTGEMGMTPAFRQTPSEKDPATAAPAGRLAGHGLAVRRRTVLGYPAEAILDLAHAEEVDLIAMATHGRSGFSRWFLGSVAERVLRHAAVPLLLVRAGRDKEAAKAEPRRESNGKLLRI